MWIILSVVLVFVNMCPGDLASACILAAIIIPPIVLGKTRVHYCKTDTLLLHCRDLEVT